MKRHIVLGGGAIAVLVGLVIAATTVVGQRDPTGWLDQNLERTDDNAWLSQDPPLVTAERLADAVEPGSMVVSSWGIALRYGRGTVSVVAGPQPGTASVYWDASARRSHRHYRFGRYRWWSDTGSGDPSPGTGTGGRPLPGQEASFTPLTPDAEVQTRRGEDFRGGGPGGGK